MYAAITPYLGEIASTACAAFWSLAVVCFIRAGRDYSPAAINLFKNTLGIPLIALAMLATGVDFFPDVGWWQWGLLAITGVLGITLADTLMFASYVRVGAAWGAVIGTMHPPFMILVTAICFGVPLTVSVALGTALIVFAILFAHDRSQSVEDRRALTVGLGIGALGMLIMAIAIALMKYPIAGHTPPFDAAPLLLVTFWRLVFGTIALAGWMAVKTPDEIRGAYSFAPTWKWLTTGSVLGGFLAMIIWIYGLREITGSLTRAVILNNTSAIFMPLFGWWLLREHISVRKTVSIALAFLGAIVVVIGK